MSAAASRRATVRDIAREAGVSAGAASVVLNGGTSRIGVSAATRRRVLEAASKLGYRTNAAARATSTGRYGAAGMVFGRNHIDSYVGPERLDALLRTFGDAGMNLCLACMDDSKLTDEAAVAGALSRLYADGLLVAYNSRIPRAFPQLLEKLRVPAVWLNAKRATNAVYPDDRTGTEALARAFLDRGMRNLVFAADPGRSHYSFADRREGFETAVAEAGLRPQTVVARIDRRTGVVSPEPYRRLFTDASRHPAIVAYATGPILDAVLAAARDAGRRHGRDWFLATFAEKPFDVDGAPATIAVTDERAFAAAVLDVFRRVTANPAVSVPSISVPYGIQPVCQGTRSICRNLPMCVMTARTREQSGKDRKPKKGNHHA